MENGRQPPTPTSPRADTATTFVGLVQPAGGLRTLQIVHQGDETDAQLWPRAAAGDGNAFAVLFDRRRDRVCRHACRLVDTRPDAQDVVAVTYLG